MKRIDPEKRDHRWGFEGTGFQLENGDVTFKSDRPEFSFFANQPLPSFRPYVEDMIGARIFDEALQQEVHAKHIPAPVINQQWVTALEQHFSADKISHDPTNRLVHSHGQTTSEEICKVLYRGTLSRVVDMVVYPENREEVQQLVTLAAGHDVCLIPYGGGTSVSSALLVPASERRMVVSVDMRRMNRILWLDESNRLACIEAGVVGRHLEEQLAARGFTMGHEPDSLEFSTLGGWISTNASGMKRNKYGNIEDIVINFELVTPKGAITHAAWHDRVSAGMNLGRLAFGHEGNLGIITSAVVRLHPGPESKEYESVLFRDFGSGVGFLKAVAASEIKPASVRLVDNNQFKFGMVLKPAERKSLKRLADRLKKFMILDILKMHPDRMCLATIVMEGARDEVRHQKSTVQRLARKHRGLLAGAGNGKRGYGLTSVIAYIRDFLLDYQCIGETLETTVPWDKIEAVGKALETTLTEQHKVHRLPGKPYLSYRVTQLYHSSVCMYIMFGVYTRGVERAEDVFTLIEQEMRDAVLRQGGSLSHHHGVGKLRKPFIGRVTSPAEIELYHTIKKHFDPGNVFGVNNTI